MAVFYFYASPWFFFFYHSCFSVSKLGVPKIGIPTSNQLYTVHEGISRWEDSPHPPPLVGKILPPGGIRSPPETSQFHWCLQHLYVAHFDQFFTNYIYSWDYVWSLASSITLLVCYAKVLHFRQEDKIFIAIMR